MDAFDYYNDDNVKKASEKYSRFVGAGVGEIKKLFRVMEICLVLVSLTWAYSRLPFAVRISGEYFRWLVNVVVSHLFVFLLSNVIVLILFFKSRHLFSQQDNIIETQMDFCQEFIEESDGGGGAVAAVAGEISSKPEEIVVYQDKQTILEVTTTEVRVHRRSQSSENLSDNTFGGNCVKQLRRSETEKQRRGEETAAENVEVVDELSNEEFQRAIDAFIAKQIKFHQQEKLAIVPHHEYACI